jgi:hypothetical protein
MSVISADVCVMLWRRYHVTSEVTLISGCGLDNKGGGEHAPRTSL